MDYFKNFLGKRSIIGIRFRYYAVQLGRCSGESEVLPDGGGEGDSPMLSLRESVDATERAAIVGALERADGSRRKAAALLGVARTTLDSKLKKHGLARLPV